ncbi:MAG: OmpH family outer membrane protein [Akkermansiaceae bacterium]|jgi:outer membrane protein
MKLFKSIITLAFGSLIMSSASAQEEKDDKIATVNMQKLVAEFYKTAETRDSFKVYEEQIKEQNDTRVDAIKAIVEEAKKLQKQTDDPSLTREKKNELFNELNRKQQEVQGLDGDRTAWIQRRQAALTEKAKIDFGEVRMELLKIVQTYGETEGYDYIFDRSGASGAGVPILSYTKDATDLTPLLLEIINKDAPEEAPKSE